MVGVVVLQCRAQAHARPAQPRSRLRVNVTAGGVRRPVSTIRAEGKNAGVRAALDPRGCRQRQLLIPAAFARSLQMHHRLAARQKSKRSPAVLMLPCDRGEKSARLACLAAQARCQHERLVAEAAAGLRRAAAERLDAAGHEAFRIRQRLRRLGAQQRPSRV